VYYYDVYNFPPSTPRPQTWNSPHPKFPNQYEEFIPYVMWRTLCLCDAPAADHVTLFLPRDATQSAVMPQYVVCL